MKITKKKQPKIVEAKIIVEPEVVPEVEPVVEPEIIPIVEPEIKPVEVKPVVEEIKPKTRAKKVNKEKSICRVVYASPSYFIVLKNGEEIRINEKNNYRRGEDVYI